MHRGFDKCFIREKRKIRVEGKNVCKQGLEKCDAQRIVTIIKIIVVRFIDSHILIATPL